MPAPSTAPMAVAEIKLYAVLQKRGRARVCRVHIRHHRYIPDRDLKHRTQRLHGLMRGGATFLDALHGAQAHIAGVGKMLLGPAPRHAVIPDG